METSYILSLVAMDVGEGSASISCPYIEPSSSRPLARLHSRGRNVVQTLEPQKSLYSFIPHPLLQSGSLRSFLLLVPDSYMSGCQASRGPQRHSPFSPLESASGAASPRLPQGSMPLMPEMRKACIRTGDQVTMVVSMVAFADGSPSVCLSVMQLPTPDPGRYKFPAPLQS